MLKKHLYQYKNLKGSAKATWYLATILYILKELRKAKNKTAA